MNQNDIVFNRFILYYTIRHYWKFRNKLVKELYILLFKNPKTNKGNRTLYNRIMSEDINTNLDKWLDELKSKSGIDKVYWNGTSKIETGIRDDIWEQYIENKDQASSTEIDAYHKAKRDIDKRLRALYTNEKSQSPTISALLHFLDFGDKKSDYTIEGRMKQILNEIKSLRKLELDRVESEQLRRYLIELKAHANRIAALIEMKAW